MLGQSRRDRQDGSSVKAAGEAPRLRQFRDLKPAENSSERRARTRRRGLSASAMPIDCAVSLNAERRKGNIGNRWLFCRVVYCVVNGFVRQSLGGSRERKRHMSSAAAEVPGLLHSASPKGEAAERERPERARLVFDGPVTLLLADISNQWRHRTTVHLGSADRFLRLLLLQKTWRVRSRPGLQRNSCPKPRSSPTGQLWE
jgi:hypothetical protein